MNLKGICRQNWFWLMMAIAVFLINQLPFLTDIRPVMYDEAWYANTAYHFSQGEGFLNSLVGSGGNANFLLPILTGAMFWIFGYTLFSIRLTAVLCGVVTLVMIHLCLKELKSRVIAEIAVLAFFVSIALYNTIFRFGRPECTSIMCMTGGIWFMLRYMKQASWGNMIGLACSTYLAAVAHPYTLLFFAIAGVVLLIQVCRGKQWIKFLHLLLLLIMAIFAMISMACVSNTYDLTGSQDMLGRVSISNYTMALLAYIKHCFFSKSVLYMLLIVPVIVMSYKSADMRIRSLAGIITCFFILFPFIFSSDVNMIVMGMDYLVIVGTLLIAPCVDRINEMNQNYYKRTLTIVFVFYCLMNIGLSYYYNYCVKYEYCNTILERELRAVIPEDAIVYTSMRQYPFLMENKCYSDHYRGKLLPMYDYIVINSQDEDRYENTIEVKRNLNQYDLIYTKSTKQYGLINVYKHNESQSKI